MNTSMPVKSIITTLQKGITLVRQNLKVGSV